MDSKTKAQPRVVDQILTWSCNGITSSEQKIDVAFNVSSIQCVRISYALDGITETGYSFLKCPSLFNNDIIGTFADSHASNDSGYQMLYQSSRMVSGTHNFTWNDGAGGARTGTIYVHLRFIE